MKQSIPRGNTLFLNPDTYVDLSRLNELVITMEADSSIARYEIRIWKNYPIRTILEVGSGGSGISAFLNPAEYEIVLLDTSRMRLQEAKGENLHVVYADGCYLPFRSSVFDLVTLIATFEHILKGSRNLFAKEAERVARRKLNV